MHVSFLCGDVEVLLLRSGPGTRDLHLGRSDFGLLFGVVATRHALCTLDVCMAVRAVRLRTLQRGSSLKRSKRRCSARQRAARMRCAMFGFAISSRTPRSGPQQTHHRRFLPISVLSISAGFSTTPLGSLREAERRIHDGIEFGYFEVKQCRRAFLVWETMFTATLRLKHSQERYAEAPQTGDRRRLRSKRREREHPNNEIKQSARNPTYPTRTD